MHRCSNASPGWLQPPSCSTRSIPRTVSCLPLHASGIRLEPVAHDIKAAARIGGELVALIRLLRLRADPDGVVLLTCDQHQQRHGPDVGIPQYTDGESISLLDDALRMDRSLPDISGRAEALATHPDHHSWRQPLWPAEGDALIPGRAALRQAWNPGLTGIIVPAISTAGRQDGKAS